MSRFYRTQPTESGASDDAIVSTVEAEGIVCYERHRPRWREAQVKRLVREGRLRGCTVTVDPWRGRSYLSERTYNEGTPEEFTRTYEVWDGSMSAAVYILLVPMGGPQALVTALVAGTNQQHLITGDI